jgi:hypothetical protein
MRFLNMRQLANIPDADGSFEGVQQRAEQRAQLKQQYKESLARQQKQIDMASARRAEMLKRSLDNNGRAVVHARARQGSGQVAQYGVMNPLLGFVDEVPAHFKDFSAHTAVPVAEFRSVLAAKDVGYTALRDFPLVLDSKGGDFSGVLTDEAHSPDFSMRIMDDVRQDFGYVPQRKSRRRR